MGLAGVPARASHPTMSALASFALHAGAVALILSSIDERVAPPPAPLTQTPIEVVDPPPPQPPPLAAARIPEGAMSGARGRRGRDGAPQSRVPAPPAPALPDPYADLAVSYDAPSGPDPGNPAGTTGAGWGTGLSGLGTGAGYGQRGSGYGVGSLPIPPPPPPLHSLARAPRVKSATYDWYITDRSALGTYVLLELTIDPEGKVRNVRVLKGIEAPTNTRAVDLARDFTFEPALDPYGHPTFGLYRWVFLVKGPHRAPWWSWRGRN